MLPKQVVLCLSGGMVGHGLFIVAAHLAKPGSQFLSKTFVQGHGLASSCPQGNPWRERKRRSFLLGRATAANKESHTNYSGFLF